MAEKLIGFTRVNKAAYGMCRQLIRNKYRRGLAFILLGAFVLSCLGHLFVNCNTCASLLLSKQITNTKYVVEIFSFSSETSVPSYILYLLELSIALLLFVIAFFYKKKYCFFFCILYGMIFVDDFLMFHETFGRVLSTSFNLPLFFSSREQDTGEILAWLSASIFLLFFIKFLRGLPIKDCIFSILLGYSFGLLLFFGFFLDTVVVPQITSPYLSQVVVGLEEGGEFFALLITLILVFCKYHQCLLHSKRT